MKSTTEHEVVIVGAGPTGLTLAAELAIAGVDALVLERRATQDLPGSRAGGLHARTIELLDQRGALARFLAEGKPMPVVHYASIPLDLADFPSRHPYTLALWQSRIEHLLAAWAGEVGARIERSCEVAAVTPGEDDVEVTLGGGRTVRARYVVGCDGGRSLVRKAAGIELAGWDPSVSYLIAEASTREEPAWGLRHGERGVQAIGKLDEGARMRVVLIEPEVRQGETPEEDELREALVSVYGTDFGVHDVTWLSRFTDAARQAERYRAGRVLLAGDAAHVHSPVGGQGLNLGVQDAMNLGWKLAQVVRGVSPDALLDSYHAERHPVGARVLEMTLAATALSRGDARTQALRTAMTAILAADEPRRRQAGMLSGLDVHYDLGAGHPLLGRRVPDLDLITDEGPTRVFAMLHDARHVLLRLDAASRAYDIAVWADRVRCVDARSDGPWTLPVIGTVPAPAALLVRPDGYVAWVGSGSDTELADALERCLGPRP